ncbi:MAG: FeoB-associated Cys-rich membrane protein [Bacilli bacterium]|nr:FeoB-associated Cys-rich membrane protein [Bacilli bacterium]
MKPIDFIIIAAIIIIIGLAVIYIVRAKKSGQKCVGCPYSKTCGKSSNNCTCNNINNYLEKK